MFGNFLLFCCPAWRCGCYFCSSIYFFMQQPEPQGFYSGTSSVFLELLARGGLPTFAFVAFNCFSVSSPLIVFRYRVHLIIPVLGRRKKHNREHVKFLKRFIFVSLAASVVGFLFSFLVKN